MAQKKEISGSGSAFDFADAAGSMLVDAIDTSMYSHIALNNEANGKDGNYSNIWYLWTNIINSKTYIDQRIILSEMILTEWLPMSPGRYYTFDAGIRRIEAKSYLMATGKKISPEMYAKLQHSLHPNTSSSPGKPTPEKFLEYNPWGKANMIQGGIGTVRLTPKYLFNEKKFFILGASSNGVCHEGIPVLLTPDLYSSIVSDLKENCGVRCNLVGKLCILPTEQLPIAYPRSISKYCLWVEDIQEVKPVHPDEIQVTVAVNFADRSVATLQKKWSYVTFNPDPKEEHLVDATEWLDDYMRRYSVEGNVLVLSDFDEYKDHFAKVEFPLKDLAAGRIDIERLEQYSKPFKIKIMGDYINNSNNSGTIIIGSTVTNSLNKVKDGVDAASADWLKEITLAVQNSGNKEAAENMEGFHQELAKPEPKKTFLKSFWAGVTTALPSLVANSDKMIDLIEKVTKMVGG